MKKNKHQDFRRLFKTGAFDANSHDTKYTTYFVRQSISPNTQIPNKRLCVDADVADIIVVAVVSSRDRY